MDNSLPSIDYQIQPMTRISIRRTENDQNHLIDKCQVKVDGKWFDTTGRFWNSFFSYFGFSESMFRYFQHQEVFDRICTTRPDTELRFSLDTDSKRLLAVSSPKKIPIRAEVSDGLFRKYKARDIQYVNGILTGTFIPQSGSKALKIGPDEFRNEYVLDVPVDGYGAPSIYLSLLRIVCENGAIARAPAFKSDLVVGKDPAYNLARSIDTFDSDDGYSAVRQRYLAAQKAPASLRECLGLFKRLKPLGSDIIKTYEKVVGDIYGVYGVANLDAISEKRLRLLPAKCKMYDLLNLASEVATHQAKPEAARLLHGWTGSTICDEYDLEGTSSKSGDFPALFNNKRRSQGN